MGEDIKEEDAFDRAEKLAASLKEQNIKAEEILAKNQAMMTRQIMGGKSQAGQAPEPKKELTPREYANSILKGIIPPK